MSDLTFKIVNLDMPYYQRKSLHNFLAPKLGYPKVYDKGEAIKLLLNHALKSVNITDNRRAFIYYCIGAITKMQVATPAELRILSVRERIDAYFASEEYKERKTHARDVE